MENLVLEYVSALAHSLVTEAILGADFTVRLQLNYSEDITACIAILPYTPESSSNKHREKAKRYRRLLRAREEEITRLKEELSKVKDLPPAVSGAESPISSGTEKTYKINFSRSQSPSSEAKPQTVFSRKSSWERTTQTEDQTALAKAVSRHLNTPSLVDDTFQVAEAKKLSPKKKQRVYAIEDDSSSEDEKGKAAVPAPLTLPPVQVHASTDTDFLDTGRFQQSEMCTQTEALKDQHSRSKREVTVSDDEPKSEEKAPESAYEQSVEVELQPEEPAAVKETTTTLPALFTKPKKKKQEKTNVVVNISVSTPPLSLKPHKPEKQKKPRRKKAQTPKAAAKTAEPRPKSEACRTRAKAVPLTTAHIPTLSTSSKSSRSGSERQNKSLRSTVPSISEVEDPAVRQNLQHYLRTHNMSELRPATVQAVRYVARPRPARPLPRPPTPISELLYTGVYSDKESWKGVMQALRDNPALLSKFITAPVQGEEITALPAVLKESSNTSLQNSQEQRSSSASARLAVLSRNGRRYRVLDYTAPQRELPSPPSRQSPDSQHASRDPSRSSSRRPVSRTQKLIKDWSLSPLDEEVVNGHYNFNWQKDVSVMGKPETVALVKMLQEGGELENLQEVMNRAVNTARKLQVDLFVQEVPAHSQAFPTVPGLISVLNDCLQYLRMRQLTISVLHYLHQRDEAILNAMSGSTEDENSEGQVQQLTKLLRKALREWKDSFPAHGEFLYLGKDYLEEVAADSYLDGSIREEDLKH